MVFSTRRYGQFRHSCSVLRLDVSIYSRAVIQYLILDKKRVWFSSIRPSGGRQTKEIISSKRGSCTAFSVAQRHGKAPSASHTGNRFSEVVSLRRIFAVWSGLGTWNAGLRSKQIFLFICWSSLEKLSGAWWQSDATPD